MNYLNKFNTLGEGADSRIQLLPTSPEQDAQIGIDPEDYIVDRKTLKAMILELPELGSGFFSAADHPDYPVLAEALKTLEACTFDA